MVGDAVEQRAGEALAGEHRRVNGGVKMYRRGGAKVSHGLGFSLSR